MTADLKRTIQTKQGTGEWLSTTDAANLLGKTKGGFIYHTRCPGHDPIVPVAREPWVNGSKMWARTDVDTIATRLDKS